MFAHLAPKAPFCVSSRTGAAGLLTEEWQLIMLEVLKVLHLMIGGVAASKTGGNMKS